MSVSIHYFIDVCVWLTHFYLAYESSEHVEISIYLHNFMEVVFHSVANKAKNPRNVPEPNKLGSTCPMHSKAKHRHQDVVKESGIYFRYQARMGG